MFSYLSSLIYGPKEVPTRPPLTRQPRPLPGVEALAASLSSSTALLLPHGDTADAYLEARWDRTWNIDVIGTPSGIVVAEGEDDVVETVRYAAKHLKTVTLAVICGRHSSLCLKDDVLVLDLRHLSSISIDPVSRTANVGGGCLLGDVDAACAEKKLAVTFGHDPSTGVGGLTLNGGHGFLEKKFGMTIDNLISAKVVLASGEVVRASEKLHPDLFWALRGGGGNWGVVTEFEFQLHELPNEGMLIGGTQVHMPYWPLENRDQLLERFVRTTEFDDDCSGAIVFTSTPVVMIWVHTGEQQQAKEFFEKNVWPHGYPLVDETKKFSSTGVSYWRHLQQAIRGPDGSGTARRHYYVSSLVAASITAELRATLVALQTSIPNSDCALIAIPTGGKSHREKNGCVATREGTWWILMQGSWGRDCADPVKLASDRVTVVSWVRAANAALTPHCAVGSYGTLSTFDSIADREAQEEKGGEKKREKNEGGSRTVYGEHLPRLRQVKKKYDPNDVFTVCHHILPAE